MANSLAAFGRQDATAAIAAAQREGFPPGTILFLDQEEGGRLLPEQADYLLAWTEAVAQSAFLPGVYASGQPVADGRGLDGKPVTITTIQDIRARVAEVICTLSLSGLFRTPAHPHPAALCNRLRPASVAPWTPPLGSLPSLPNANPSTRACARTYSSDGNCDTPAPARLDVDLSSATTSDPSHGR